MKKIKLKRIKKHFKTLIFLTLISLITSILLINNISKKIRPSLFKYAEIETKKFSNIIINDAIAKKITNQITPDEIFIINNNKNDEIKSIDFNTPIINKYLTEVTKSIQKDMNDIEKGNINNISKEITKNYNRKDLKKGIIYTLNTGIISESPLLSNLGPKIPVKINLIGDIISYVSADIEDYGINNSIIKVFINLKVTEQIVIPLNEKNIDMEAKVPIAIKLITGKLPDYYIGTKESKQIVIPN